MDFLEILLRTLHFLTPWVTDKGYNILKTLSLGEDVPLFTFSKWPPKYQQILNKTSFLPSYLYFFSNILRFITYLLGKIFKSAKTNHKNRRL